MSGVESPPAATRSSNSRSGPSPPVLRSMHCSRISSAPQRSRFSARTSGRPSGRYRSYPNDWTAQPSLTVITPIRRFLSMAQPFDQAAQYLASGLLALLGVELEPDNIAAADSAGERGRETRGAEVEVGGCFEHVAMVEIDRPSVARFHQRVAANILDR